MQDKKELENVPPMHELTCVFYTIFWQRHQKSRVIFGVKGVLLKYFDNYKQCWESVIPLFLVSMSSVIQQPGFDLASVV